VDEELRRLERDARTDAEARVRWLAALRRAGAPPTWPTRDGPWSGNRDFPDVDLRPPLRVEWEYTAGAGHGQCVGGAGQLYVTHDKNDVVCLDLATGETSWKRRLPRSRTHAAFALAGPWLITALGRETSALPVDGGDLITWNGGAPLGLFRNGDRTRLLLAGGTADLSSLEFTGHEGDWTGRIHLGVLYGDRGGGELSAIDPAHPSAGAERWWQPDDAVVDESVEVVADGHVLTLDGTTLRVRSAADGTQRWACEWPVAHPWITPAVSAGHVVTYGVELDEVEGPTSIWGPIRTRVLLLQARDLVNGQVTWSDPMPTVVNPINMVSTRGVVWLADNQGGNRFPDAIVAIDTTTGQQLWRMPMNANVSQLLVIDDRLLAIVGRKVTCLAPEGAPSSLPAKKVRKKKA
jgi:outer membrane protein assembly factor BamB